MSEEHKVIALPHFAPVRGLRGGHPPIAGDIVHVCSDDGICIGGMVSMTFEDEPMDPLVTLMIPQAQAPAMCIGRVKHSDAHSPRTWHDPQKCKGERSGSKGGPRIIA